MTAAAGADLWVDIVVDNHDYEAYVGEAVTSACAQDHPRVRVVVVDDGSTDGSRAVLREVAGAAELVLKDNGGQASAFNAGLARCQGDVVMFLDADDRLDRDAAGRVAAAFAAAPRAARVQFRLQVVDAEGTPTGAVKPPAHLAVPAGDLAAPTLGHPYDLVCLPTTGNAFRLSLLRSVLPIPEEDYPRCGADWYLVHLSSLLGPVVAVDDILGAYRVHGGNAYEPARPRLDLGRVRQSIAYAAATTPALERLADREGIPRPARILSTSDLANRLISLRLDPAGHPVPGEGRGHLLADAARALARRHDVTPPMKVLFLAWFAATAVAPQPAVRLLGELFLHPERRRGAEGLLARMRRRPAADAGRPA